MRNNNHNHNNKVITRNKKINGGRPSIRGTRISVDDILRALTNGHDLDFIVNRTKSCGISKKDIQHALDYVKAQAR